MDPDTALANARAAFERYADITSDTTVDAEVILGEAAEALEAFHSLDEWLTKGGFPPRAWGPWYTVGPRP